MKLIPAILVLLCSAAAHAAQWVTYDPPKDVPAKGKHIVMLSGDEEYRSEEGLPQLAKILSQRHGFKCTVLFSQDPATGAIDPNNQTNIPGMNLLAEADLMVCQFRFREPSDSDMKYFDGYVHSGKPFMVLRTATHAFSYSRDKKSPFAKYDWQSKEPGWVGGFGGKFCGETWTYHHGDHGHEGTRGLLNSTFAKHPILKGVVDVFGPTDVYGVNPDFPADAQVLMQGMVVKSLKPDDAPNLKKPIMPLVWLREVPVSDGKKAKVLTSTIGAGSDLVSEDLRRLFVNASLWMTDQPVPERADVTLVGEYNPTFFGFNKAKKGVMVSEHALK